MNFFLLFRVYLFKILFKFNYIVRKTVNEKKVLLLIKSFKIYKTNYKLIRLGEAGDGGYLLPDDLLEISACFSGGAGSTVKFEYDLANLGIKCFIADYSVDNLPSPHHQNFIFLKKFLGTENSDEYINFAKKRIALDKEDTKEEKIKIKNLVLKNNPNYSLTFKRHYYYYYIKTKTKGKFTLPSSFL